MGFFKNTVSGIFQTKEKKLVDVADYVKKRSIANETLSTFRGEMYATVWEGVIPSQNIRWFYQDITDDQKTVKMKGFTCDVLAGNQGSQMDFEIFVEATTINDTIETIEGYNLDARKRTSDPTHWITTNKIKRVAGFNGGTLIESWFVDNDGLRISKKAQTLGLIGLFNFENRPFFRVQNKNNSTNTVTLTWIWQVINGNI